jgi:hypothetical protein
MRPVQHCPIFAVLGMGMLIPGWCILVPEHKVAALETDKFKIRVQLTKPVTWVPLIWGKR